MAKVNRESRLNFLRRTVTEIKQYKLSMRILKMLAVLLIIPISVMYVSAALYKNTGSFTVSVDKIEMSKYGLSLSETKDMLYKTSHLNANVAKDITNIAEEWIPDNVDMIDGQHNGDNYIAYTFYLQNAGDVEVSYEYIIGISNITNGLDEAIRVRLYMGDEDAREYITYAKTSSDGSGPEKGTTEFVSTNEVAKQRVEDFKPGETMKYTVVVWIEGNDPDCIDWLIGGRLKIDMSFEIVH